MGGGYSLRALLPTLSGLLLLQFVSGLSATVVATSLPSIMVDLRTSSAASTWLVAATILANTATTPLWGKLGDRINRRSVLLGAAGVFGAGCALAAAAGSFSLLLCARALMGAGLGGIGALCLVVIAALVPERERGRANGLAMSVQTVGTMAGPVVGGFITESEPLGWRGSFLLALPFALAAAFLIRGLLPGERLRPPVRAAGGPRPDVVGGILMMSGVVLALLCVTAVAESRGDFSPAAVLSGVGGLALLALAVTLEWRAEDPVVPVRLLRQRTPALVCGAAFAVGCTLFGGSVFISQYLQLGLRLPASAAGLALMPMAAGTVASAWAAGRWIAAGRSLKTVLVCATASVVAGFGVLSAINAAPLPLTVAGTVLLALGTGCALQNLVLMAQTVTAPGMLSTVSATVLFFFSLGGSVGLIMLGALLSGRLGAAGLLDEAAAHRAALPAVFLASAVIASAALAAVCLLPRRRIPAAEPAAHPDGGPTARPTEPAV